MSTAQRLIEQGREQGLHQGAKRLLARQLTARFGRLEPEILARLDAASLAEIERWAERVVAATTSIDEVFRAT